MGPAALYTGEVYADGGEADTRKGRERGSGPIHLDFFHDPRRERRGLRCALLSDALIPSDPSKLGGAPREYHRSLG